MRRQNWERTAVPEPAERATVAQILWLRLRMRRIGLTAVFVSDCPLHAELFDRAGRYVSTVVVP